MGKLTVLALLALPINLELWAHLPLVRKLPRVPASRLLASVGERALGPVVCPVPGAALHLVGVHEEIVALVNAATVAGAAQIY